VGARTDAENEKRLLAQAFSDFVRLAARSTAGVIPCDVRNLGPVDPDVGKFPVAQAGQFPKAPVVTTPAAQQAYNI
jgi:hypothetical protein